jgi:hypothetical protein
METQEKHNMPKSKIALLRILVIASSVICVFNAPLYYDINLVENAIDAGATKISVTLECSGKNLIVIKDNGFGMTKEELELAILRHATSKLDEDDLLNINSFGFRGEALPSIGAISKFKIRTILLID